ncbi:MAG: hypothetical protein WCO44_08695 [Bacteroidota bacterium]
MKKYKVPPDDLLRDALKDHRITPSEDARRAFLMDAMQLPPAEKKGRSGMIILSLLAGLTAMGILFWYANKEWPAISTGNNNPAPVKASTAAVMPKTQINQVTTCVQPEPLTGKSTEKKHAQNLSSEIISRQTEKNQPGYPLQSAPDQSVLQGAGNQPETSQYASTGTPPSANPDGSSLQGQATTPPATVEANPLQPGLTPAASQQETPSVDAPGKSTVPNTLARKPDTLVTPAKGAHETTQKKGSRKSMITPSLGVYYSPEWMFKTIEGNKFVNNFGIEGTFHFGRFSIRTGAGLSVNKGTNELSVAYNEFLGSYYKLDSIEFKWSPPAKNYIPTMYMSRKSVWDSLMKLENLRVVKQHIYLQVPMIMGYDFWQSEKISMGFTVGPVMSVLLSSKQLSAAFDPGTKRIISINDVSPGQVSLNWQAMAGLNTVFRLTKELRFEVEPEVRYYFNSVYENPEPALKPWSIGFRAALKIEF